ACGAISGFHATQSPLMARCMKNEKMGRPIFYGAMITEGMVALIWATVSSYFFFGEGWKSVCSPEVVQQFTESGKTLPQFFSAPTVVMNVCEGWLGVVGGVLALLGVVAAPITSGDTALRSARLIVAEAIGLEQRSIAKRLYICIPMFLLTMGLLVWQIENPDGFNVIWSYFGWANQSLAVFTLWTLTVYLAKEKRCFYVTLVPALFMTLVCTTYILTSAEGFGMTGFLPYGLGVLAMLILGLAFGNWLRKFNKDGK
ncbi:MAG: carbon starvation protein A, partial [Bacteroidaceae bacterium]|nr:carbon starvation protein A [Bacteroidaceae bacterium]